MGEKLDFNSLVQNSAGDVKPPPLLPTGHYEAMISGPMSPHEAKSGNVAMRFPIKLVAPGDDVDAEELEEAGGVPDKQYNLDFWMSTDAQFRFTDFTKSVGLFDSNLTLADLAEKLVEETPTFMVEVTHEQDSRNPEKVYMRIDNPAGDQEIA